MGEMDTPRLGRHSCADDGSGSDWCAPTGTRHPFDPGDCASGLPTRLWNRRLGIRVKWNTRTIVLATTAA